MHDTDTNKKVIADLKTKAQKVQADLKTIVTDINENSGVEFDKCCYATDDIFKEAASLNVSSEQIAFIKQIRSFSSNALSPAKGVILDGLTKIFSSDEKNNDKILVKSN